MWQLNWREKAWSQLNLKWDVIIIGGGITGAGILREATRSGLRSLLVEADDFASGTSSRSSKLVHGGFRYLKNAQVKLVLDSVRERERLLSEGRGLINSLGFLLPIYQSDSIPAWMLGLGLSAYDLLALKWGHRFYDSNDLRELCPSIKEEGLQGGYRFFDAQTDDARLVLRVIQEAVQDGGTALNYARVEALLRDQSGKVCGVVLRDTTPENFGHSMEVSSSLVINATGAWADDLRSFTGAPARLRKLRGSHLIFPRHKFPLTRAVSFWHPIDHRPVFAIPWEGITLLGTTDVDHTGDMVIDPAISTSESEYLLCAVANIFPALNLALEDVQSTFSGIRSVVDTGKSDPSKESRDFVLWNDSGLLTITGGKLTTFRLMAHNALRAGRQLLPEHSHLDPELRMLNSPSMEAWNDITLNHITRLRLLGRYGDEAVRVLSYIKTNELTPIKPSTTLWGELRWSARFEAVVHLDDLLLRRTRLGLILPHGGLSWLPRIRTIVQSELGWDDPRWESEALDYCHLWEQSYSIGSKN